MQRTATVLLALSALALAACGGTPLPSIDPLAGGPDDELVLSACTPSDAVEREVVVERGDPPPLEDLQARLDGGDAASEDARFMVDQMVADGVSEADALLDAYAQQVGNELFQRAQAAPGYVTGAYARPSQDEPFELAFAEGTSLPDVDDLDLAPFGLVVLRGVEQVDQDAMVTAMDAARELGLRPVSGSPDQYDGTYTVEVLPGATDEQVAAWEQAVDDPRACLRQAAPSVACDDQVVADAEARADTERPVLANQGQERPDPERAEQVRRSYLGLTLEEAQDKAAQEDRAVRVGTEDGVQLGAESDLQPGRLTLTLCDGVVVDTLMDLEGFEG